MSELQFKGYAYVLLIHPITKTITRRNSVHDTKKWSEFKLIDFESKRFEDYDVEVKIDYCGVCGSDVCAIASRCYVVLIGQILGPYHHRWLG